MDTREGRVLDIKFNSAYNTVFWIVGFCTLGIGSLAMYVSTRSWPKRMDEEGITRQDGKRFRWDEITGTTAVTVINQVGQRVTGRLDLVAGKEKILIALQSIDPSDEVLQLVREKLGDDRISPG